MGAASLLVALALSSEHAFAAVQLQAEARGAAPLQDGTSFGVTPEIAIHPSVDAGLVSGLLRAEVGYHPQLTVTGLTPALLHRLQASAEWRLAPSRRALVDQSLSFGQYDTSLGNLGAGGATLPDGILPLGIVDYLTSDSALGFDGALVPRLLLRAAIGYHASGGLTDAARATVPLQQGPRLTLELQHQATRRDALSASLKVSADRFSLGRTAAVAEGAAIWRTQLTREALLSLGAGAAAVASDGPGGAQAPAAVPVASAAFTYGLPRVALSVDARFSPQADALSGLIYQRAGGTFSGEWRPRSDYTARATFGGTWSVAGQNAGDRTLQGETSLSYHDAPLDLSFGVRVADVALAASAVPHATELRAFVAVSLKGATVR